VKDYVEWVSEVMEAAAQAWHASDPNKKLIGISIHDVIPAMCFDIDTRSADFNRTKVAEGVRNALSDLTQMGLLEEEYGHYKLTHEGSKFPQADLSTAWGQVTNIHLDEGQIAFLRKVAEIGQENYDKYVCVKDLTAKDVFEALEWPWDDAGKAKGYLITEQLESIGMINRRAYMGGHIDVIPTYIGIVRVTRQAESEWGRIVRQLIDEWETTNVDFKRQLNLNRDKEKAEFIRDVLGLATTKSSGRRFLVIGFDDTTHSFVQSVDPNITQERLEQVLTAYSEPTPKIRYQTIPWSSGTIGIIEIFREPRDIPYRVKKDIGGKSGIKTGEIYVRHGSHTEAPTQRELEGLM
jgi:hypothetical protein